MPCNPIRFLAAEKGNKRRETKGPASLTKVGGIVILNLALSHAEC